MNCNLQGVATDVSSIKEVVTDLKNLVNVIQERLDAAEGLISNMEDVTSKLVSDANSMINAWKLCGIELRI